MKYFLIGIKGTGMSALAKILYDLGNDVSGSDYDTYFFTEKNLWFAKIYPLGTVLKDHTYIVGNAFIGSKDHIEAVSRGYDVCHYTDFVSTIEGIGIAISGTHGKTTTSSLIAHLFQQEKICYLIGDGSGHGEKNNDYFIYEACEYKKHFLAYNPHFLVVNNVELDHTDYYKDIEEIIYAFQEMINKSDIALVNIDNENCKKLIGNNIITFGFDKEADYVITILDNSYPYKIKISHDKTSYYYHIPFYGKYMIYNCASAIITCLIHNISDIQKNLDSFVLPSRRLTEYQFGKYTVIDDYAHHPTEIKATIEALKEKYNKDFVLVFEPHTYTRTNDLFDDFIDVLKDVKNLFIADVYSSVRESKINNYSLLLENLENAKLFNGDIKELLKCNIDIIVFMGAGTINKYIDDFKYIKEM